MRPLAVVSSFAFSAAVAAQTVTGDIAVTGFSTNAFGVVAAGGGVTGYATTGFLGTGPATSQAILWDRAQPNEFLIGGFGFVGRATVLGPGSVVWTLITNAVGIVSQMTLLDGGLVVFVDSGTSQVRLLDPAAGTVTDLTSGAQPWGADASSGSVDPRNGDLVVGGNAGIWRVPFAGGTAVPVATGLGGYVTAIAFDPTNGDVIATVLTVNRVIRIDGNGAVTDVAPPFSVPGPNALAVDPNGDFVTGGGTGQVWRVPRAGGAPVFLANNTSPPNAVNGLAVVGGGGFGIPFGQACNGAVGPAQLTATGSYVVGATVTTTSTNHAPNALGVLVLGVSDTDWLGTPLPALLDPQLGTVGCSLWVSGDTLQAGIASAGSPAVLQYQVLLQPIIAGFRFYAQHVCLEAVPGGLSWSNGLAFRVP
ncbi:MAG: hypothetical protein JNL08_20825 [Planctomycetes bacterium]|nr:hypothetical protein [Planctomycetota bacterium]